MKTLRDIGEDALIARLLGKIPASDLRVGPGDDCAVVDDGRGPLRLLKTDAIVEGVHFLREAAPAKVGWKAVARVISDFAAMGGRPRHLLVTVALPADLEIRWAEGLYRGIGRCLEAWGGQLAGGETTAVPEGGPVMVSVAGEGVVDRRHCVGRRGGKPGDVLAVTGALGGSMRGRHLSFEPRLAEGERLARGGARAMMDLSDGLAKDLPRLAKACGCGFEVAREAIPRSRGVTIEAAISDGEDYELLAAVEPRKWDRLVLDWPPELAPLQAIGRLVESGGTLAGGWEHFTS
ncbi:thiamine-phosphate kinase [Haloferula sargassicola]|uniref:Thiamine-monophosphate kinase n=1 Tax=Haloferula sargassicola TaxID=490096 RepID=A0ABP9UVR4_9BACT